MTLKLSPVDGPGYVDVMLAHTLDERFHPDTADQLLGRHVTVTLNGTPRRGRVIDAHVDDLGLHATIEIPGQPS